MLAPLLPQTAKDFSPNSEIAELPRLRAVMFPTKRDAGIDVDPHYLCGRPKAVTISDNQKRLRIYTYSILRQLRSTQGARRR